MKKWGAAALVLATAATLAAVPIHISALEEKAYEEMVQTIYSGFAQGKEQFEVKYTGVLLERDDLSSAVREALGSSVNHLFRVAGYSYVQNGKNVEFHVNYSHINDYEITFAPTEGEIVRILERAIAQRQPGVNIFVLSQGERTVEEMKNQAQDCFQSLSQNSGDDYSKYCVKQINFGVTTVSSSEQGYFLTYSFAYNENLEQTAQVDAYVETLLAQLQLDGKSQREQVELINQAVSRQVEYLDTGHDRDYTAYGAMYDGTAVCQGYSLLADRIMKGAGLDCRIVAGKARDPYTGSEGAHMWNIVRVDGDWLHLDTTWNDAYGNENPYLLVSDSQIARDHTYDTEFYTHSRLESGLELLELRRRSHMTMRLGETTMTVGEKTVEIDPGRSTTPVLEGERVLLPLRALVENLGGTVEWDDHSRQVRISYRDYEMSLWPDSARAEVNGMPMRMEMPLTTIDDRAMVMVRFVGEMLGMGIQWDGATGTVQVSPY